MQPISRSIIYTGIVLAWISLLYFLSLTVNFPFWGTVVVETVGVAVFLWFTLRKWRKEIQELYIPKLPFYILLTGIVIMVVKSQTLGLKYGGWDAWSIWNYHAKFLASGSAWWNIFYGSIDHPDYPLFVPGVIAFFLRLLGGTGQIMVPFILSFSIMLAIPVLIYIETRERSIIAAAIIFLVMASDSFFIQNSLTQYADVPLGFFFLCAMVSVSQAAVDESMAKSQVLMASACLGCCMWTKNEGIILSVIFLAFNFKRFFSMPAIKYTISGMALPLCTVFIFKHFYAPPNDIVSRQSEHTLNQFFVWSRYKIIWSHFTQELDEHFYYAKVGFALYLLVCLIGKKWPHRNFIMLCVCMLAYLTIYVVTPSTLDWQLATSLGRLMLQLMPAMMFVFAQKFSGGKMSFMT